MRESHKKATKKGQDLPLQIFNTQISQQFDNYLIKLNLLIGCEEENLGNWRKRQWNI